jgi:LPXTG cell wall anchor motif
VAEGEHRPPAAGTRLPQSATASPTFVAAGLSLAAIAVALYVLRSERAPEMEREARRSGGRPIDGGA